MLTLRAAFALERPFSERFLSLCQRCNALIEHMDKDRQQRGAALPAEAWAIGQPGLILAQPDWSGARLILRWGLDDPPRPASGAPAYELELMGLKLVALGCEQPQTWFEHYLVYALQSAQDALIEYLRDGPTDDVPFYRHQICVAAVATEFAYVWVGEVVFDRRTQPQ